MRRGWKRALVASAILVVLLGGTYVGTTDAGRIGDTDRARAFAPTCLTDDGYLPNPDVCAHAFGAHDESHGEPFFAVHPTDPDLIVMGTISRVPPREPADKPESEPKPPEEQVLDMVLGEDAEPAPEPIGPPCSGFGLCLHVTRNGGATWHQVAFPRDRTWLMVSDPTLLFTADGVLHVAGHRSGGDIVYAQTRDLGVTWRHVQVVADEAHVDRPWLSANDQGTLVLTWQSTDSPHILGAAWSDTGTTWTRFTDRPDDCILQSPARPRGDTAWLLACERSKIPARQLVRLDTTTNRATILDTDIELGWAISFISATPDGRLLITDTSPLRWTGTTIHTRYSDDQGDTWSRPIDLRRLTELDDDWEWAWLSWADTDHAGNLHALLVGGPGEHCYNQRCNDPLQRQVIWIATDPETGDLLGHALLTPADADARERPRDRNLEPTGDDYHHVIPHGDGMLLAWGHDGWVDVSSVVPVPRT